MSPSTNLRSSQRGVALLTAVLMVALATILAVNVAFRGYLDQRRAMTALAFDQSYQLALAAEAGAAETLYLSYADKPKYTHLAQLWARPMPPFPVDDGEIQGSLEDMAGRFNLNSLADPDTKKRQGYIAQFRNLLAVINLESEWADKLVDWLDSDINPVSGEGGEDDLYSSIKPPYLTANMPITRTSELLSLKGFGLERFRRLEPLVSALPIGTLINLCTAPGEVLDSFGSNLRQYSIASQSLGQQRASNCFPEVKDLETSVGKGIQGEQDRIKEVADTKSDYFRLTTVVKLGSYEFTLYSLLKRSSNGETTAAVLRSFGTE